MKKTFFAFLAFGTCFMANGLYPQEGGESAAPANAQGGLSQTFIMIGIALVFFYLILWRPEQKKRKALEERRKSLAKGDVVTAMGIVGTIDTIKDNTIILKMCDGGKIEVLKAVVTDMGSCCPAEKK